MSLSTLLTCFFALGSSAVMPAQRSAPADQTHWVATWASAQQQPRPTFIRPPAPAGGTPSAAPGTTPPAAATPTTPASAANAAVTGAAPAAPANLPLTRPPRSFNNQTLRMVVRASIGGTQLRVHLSNAFGSMPLTIGTAHIALRSSGSMIVAGSDHALLFDGKPGVTIPIGAEMISDPVALQVAPLSELAVSVYVPGDTGAASTHSLGLHTTWVSKEGDFTSSPEIVDAEKLQSWYWVSGVDVQAPADSSAIVAYGDSITDGATSTPDTDRSWPSVLAQRLAANSATAHTAIINQGISGNRVLGDGAGVSALARFDRDVLAQPGAKWLVILEGINDMNLAGRPPAAGAPPVIGPLPTADSLIAAMKQMITRAHDHGIKVVGCTVTPFGNATDKVEGMRQAMNTFIRSSDSGFDAVIDFDKVIQDPSDPRQFRKGYNNTDKLHPNDAGYKAMADSIDLGIFTTSRKASQK